MKKIILTLAVVLMLGFGAVAQDGFFRSDNGGYVDRSGEGSGISDVTPNLVGGAVGGSDSNEPAAPLGSGLLVLTALGAGYALTKKSK